MDPLLQLQIPGLIGFGARSDIFENPKTARLLRWMRIVPLARERNGLAEVAKNFEVFDEIIDCLAHDVPFCMYAEGTHHPAPDMLPIKKGLFRIAKMASEKLGKPVYIVPIGTNYEDFYRGQTRVRMRIGEPMEIAQEFARREGMPEAEVYRELCEQLRERDLSLIGEPMTFKRPGKALSWFLSVLSLPLFAVCAVGALPIWLPYLLIMRGMKDKAWAHTVRFGLHMFLPLFVPFHIGYERLLNLYRNLF
jgi:1-acyl-sn-glycerol-3-phosphate acyltransferase